LRLGVVALKIALLSVGFGIIYTLSNYAETTRPKLPAGFEDSDLALQGKRLKGYALGAEGLMADWYWILSLQYIGGKIMSSEDVILNVEDLTSLNPRLLYPYLDNATDLDPKFYAAYSYGAIVLPAIDPAKAIALTEKGIANNPDHWRFYQYLGYIYWRLKEFEKAAEIYEKGSRVPGAPPFMRQMAATMKTKGGSRDTARELYLQMLTESDDQQSKENAQLRLFELDSLDERDAVNAILQSFKEKAGRCANSYGEILPQLRTIKLPAGKGFRIDASNNIVDPTGVPYTLDRTRCSIYIGPESRIPKTP